MNSDVRDILELERQVEEVYSSKEQKRPRRSGGEHLKRPTGVSREVWSLLKKDDLDATTPLIPTTDGISQKLLYKQPKARLRNFVRKWQWKEFKNSARADNALFFHWRVASDESIQSIEYPFSKYNKKLNLYKYTDQEYKEYLEDDLWSREETDYLMNSCEAYDLRFYVIHDRWNEEKGKKRTIDEIKDRYYRVSSVLEKCRHPDDTKEQFVFDLEHETKRREQLKKLLERTKEQIDEEAYLVEELKKIEMRKRERDRKTATVNNLLTAVSNELDQKNLSVAPIQQEIISSIPKQNQHQQLQVAMKRKNKLNSQQSTESNNTSPNTATHILKPANTSSALTSSVAIEKKSLIFKATVESAGIKFPDSKTSGVTLRSYKMKLPPSVGLKKTKAIEQSLDKLQIESKPMATENICEQFNELRSDIVLLYELKQALSNCEFELQTLQHRYEAIAPGKPIGLIEMESVPSQSNVDLIVPKKISDVFDVTVTPSGSLERRRKAALNQTNILKKLRGRNT